MIHRLISSAIFAATLGWVLGAGDVHAQAAAAEAGPQWNGNLFSAVSFADSPFAREWSHLRGEAQVRFPDLELTAVEDLHVTIVYIGANWRQGDLTRIRPLALIAPPATEQLAPTLTRMGAHDQVVVVELLGSSPAWADAVTAAKATLNRQSLKQPEAYDSNFRPHLTLAQTKHFQPSQTEAAELAEFLSWMSSQVAQDPKKFTVTVGPQTPVRLLLSGITQAKNGPEYVDLEDFLGRAPAGRAGPPRGQGPGSAPGSRATTASIHRFQFGGEKTLPGFTAVGPQAGYTTENGYGFEPGPAVIVTTGDDREAVTSSRHFAFSVALPEGNYRVTVTLGSPLAEATTTVKAEVRRLMLESIHTATGEFATRTFTVNVRRPEISTGGRVNLDSREWDPAANRAVSATWDDKLTLTFSGSHPALAALEIHRADDAPTLFILGDSTVTDQPRGPGSSWGQMVTRWFQPAVAVANHAESGETLKGFLKERRWDKVLDSIKPGDYVLIEFGTNDSKDRGPQNIYPNQDFSETYAPAETTYRELLRRFVADARKRGALPIIAAPSARRGEVQGPGSLGAYAAAAMATARELGVPGIDLTAMGFELNAALGADAGRQFADRTHHVEYGSYLQAKCIVEGIKRSGLGLAKYIVDDFGDFDPSHPEPDPAHFTLPPDPAARREGPTAGAGPTSPPP